MRITVDFTSALADRTGVGTYARELTRALLRRPGGHRIRVAAHVFRHPGWRAKALKLLEGAPRPDLRPSRLLPHGAALRLWHHFRLPKAEDLFGGLDVFHGTNFLAPPVRHGRCVATIHDLAFLRLPEEAPPAHRYVRYLRRACRWFDRVLVPSEATRRDVLEFLDLPPDRIRVTPLAGPESLHPLPEAVFARERKRLRIPDHYLLFVGTLEPRKNLVRLLAACRRAAGELEGLVIAGRPGWRTGPIYAAIRETARRLPVAAPGFVSPQLRDSLLTGARGLVLPSLWEGFGLPVLEAFRAGTPVACSDAGALPEVAGNAALTFDPRDEKEMAEALVRLVKDRGAREDLVGLGRRRVEDFTWERTAERTLEGYGHD